MRQIRLRLVLPIIAVLFAGILFELGRRETGPPGLDLFAPTANMFCYGVNAPAVLLTIPYNLLVQWYVDRQVIMPWFNWRLLGFFSSDWVFFLAVALTWFLVGRELDRYRYSKSVPSARFGIRNLLVSALLTSAGLYLAYAAVFEIWGQPGNNPLGNKVEAILFLTWSLLLLIRALLGPRIRHLGWWST